MKITKIKQDWREDLDNIPHGIIRGILFSGDRYSCCDEAIVAEHEGEFIGIATIAPKGEDYLETPDIVGLYVAPKFRRRGFGLMLLDEAIERCLDRGLKTPIRVTGVSAIMKDLYHKLPGQKIQKSQFIDCSLGLNLID